ncbi:MAG: hypothetical protein NTV63_05360 [Candidatus Woesearchaeota archaeon]|nr:hypothetical protein [Candidatus Woesearchaeota archaeon]
MNKKIAESFKKVKDEFEEQLDTINEDTNEIQSNYAYLCRLDEKIDKLNEKIEQMQMLIVTANKVSSNVNIEPLTAREQEVFLILYTTDHLLMYSDIAKKLGLTENLVANYVTNLIEKRIPIFKKYQGKETFLLLEPDFRNLQAKENVLGINEAMIKQFQNDRLQEKKLSGSSRQ